MQISARLEIDSEELAQAAAHFRAVTITFPLAPGEPPEPVEGAVAPTGGEMDAGAAPEEGAAQPQPFAPRPPASPGVPGATAGDIDAGPAPGEGQPRAPSAAPGPEAPQAVAGDTDAGPAPTGGESPGEPPAPSPPGGPEVAPGATAGIDAGPAPAEGQALGTADLALPPAGPGAPQPAAGAVDAGPALALAEMQDQPWAEAGTHDAGAVPLSLLELAAQGVEPGGFPSGETVADDLTVIRGIGPKIAQILREAGIETFAQLAASDVAHLQQILSDAGVRARPDLWPEQASLAASSNMEGLGA